MYRFLFTIVFFGKRKKTLTKPFTFWKWKHVFGKNSERLSTHCTLLNRRKKPVHRVQLSGSMIRHGTQYSNKIQLECASILYTSLKKESSMAQTAFSWSLRYFFYHNEAKAFFEIKFLISYTGDHPFKTSANLANVWPVPP